MEEKIIKQMRVNDEYFEIVDEKARNELKELTKNEYIKTFEIEIEDDIRYVMYNTFNFIKEGKMQEGELVLFNGTYFSRYNISSQEFEVFDLDEKKYAHSQIIDLISDKIETLFDFEITEKKFDTTYKAGEGIEISEDNVITNISPFEKKQTFTIEDNFNGNCMIELWDIVNTNFPVAIEISGENTWTEIYIYFFEDGMKVLDINFEEINDGEVFDGYTFGAGRLNNLEDYSNIIVLIKEGVALVGDKLTIWYTSNGVCSPSYAV